MSPSEHAAVKRGFFTIASKNYLPYARVLMRSVERWHPEAARFVVLADAIDGCFDPSLEPFQIVLSADLPIPESRWLHFRYTLLELNTAIKPFAMENLAVTYGLERMIYLDPDVKLYGSLERVFELLDTSEIVLTPHLLDPLPTDGMYPSESDIVRSGTYNLGFLAVNLLGGAKPFIRWWQEKLRFGAFVDFARGTFTDQKWIDLVPGLFSGVHILREPGFNVAYWNILARPITKGINCYCAGGQPLYFVHFSGFDPTSPERFSRFQNRFLAGDLGEARELACEYAADLLAHGYEQCRSWRYAYGSFSNGEPISDVCRPYADDVPGLTVRVDDPFSETGFREYAAWWGEFVKRADGVTLTRLARRLYDESSDVRGRFPSLTGAEYRDFLEWFITTARTEYRICDAILAPARSLLLGWREAQYCAPRETIERLFDRFPPAFRDELKAREIWRQVPYASPKELVRWLNEPDEAAGTRLGALVLESRPDLQQVFSGRRGGRHRFLLWLMSFGKYEYLLTEDLLEPVRGMVMKDWSGRAWQEKLDRLALLFRALTITGRLCLRQR